MTKILHIPNYYPPYTGGIQNTAYDIVSSLKDKYEQKVICFNHEKGTKIDNVDDIEVIRVGYQVKLSSQAIALKYKKELDKVIKEFKPDIVIFHYPNPYVSSFLMKHLKHKTFKFILYWHLDITKQKLIKLFFEGQSKKLLNYADKIVATSPNYIQGSPYLKEYEDKCIVIPSCVSKRMASHSLENEKNAYKIKEQYKNKKICLFYGRHVEYKGLTYLIQASKLLSNDFVFFILGNGPLTEKLKNEAKDDKKIIFLGEVNDDELKSYLLASDIFCFPSITKNEAFGLALAEAMSYSKPAITFKIEGSGVNYVNLNNVTGIEVENKNVKEYAKAIKTLDIDKYKDNAKKRAEQLFSYDKFSSNINKLIESIVEK